ncbi:MAG: hypothetical protein Q7U53_17170 [Anaerolineaceae bacterium]|nr:hypothetical protein [Anaerolineaceae bacterium]
MCHIQWGQDVLFNIVIIRQTRYTLDNIRGKSRAIIGLETIFTGRGVHVQGHGFS